MEYLAAQAEARRWLAQQPRRQCASPSWRSWAAGTRPGRGPYRDVLERGKGYLLATARADGFLFNSGNGQYGMYEHGLATLALAELYGMDPDPKLEEVLRKAVDLIVKCQSPAGGWRYSPSPGDQDLSVTVMQIVALRAANNAEVPVPSATIEKAIAYVRSCAHPSGGFAYQAGGGPGPQTTAAGILSLQLLGKYDDPTIPKALEYLAKVPVQWAGDAGPVFLLLPLLRHPGQLPGRRPALERLAPARPRAAPGAPERRRELGRPARHPGDRGDRRPEQGLLDGHGLPGPRHLHALPAGLSALTAGFQGIGEWPWVQLHPELHLFPGMLSQDPIPPRGHLRLIPRRLPCRS